MVKLGNNKISLVGGCNFSFPANFLKGHREESRMNDDSSNIYLFKFNNRKTRKRYEMCSKLKTLERRQ